MTALAHPQDLSDIDEMFIEIASICEDMLTKYGTNAVIGLYGDIDRNPRKPLTTDFCMMKFFTSHKYDLYKAQDILNWLNENADRFEDLK